MTSPNCSIEASLSLVGEPWNLLILREVFWGFHRFSDFHNNLGLAKNLLSTRLKKLCEYDILKQVPSKPGSRRFEYHLTAKGYDLYPVLLSLMQWGDKWLFTKDQIPLILSSPDGDSVAPLKPYSISGQQLEFSSLRSSPGPGANECMRKKLKHLQN